MVEVRLHGDLARQFGRAWNLDISTVREAVTAIECARKGFRRAILDLSKRGMVFRVRSDKHDYVEQELDTSVGSIQRIDIIPIMSGASAGFRFIIGAALVAYAVVTGNPYAASIGATLVFGAVTEWLTPVPKRSEQENGNLQSWTINGAAATVDQGDPVPVIYGEVLVTGYTISAGIAASQLSPAGSLAPSVAIGGELDINVEAGFVSTYLVNVRLSAGVFNLDDPLTYNWSVTGFALASNVRIVRNGRATFHLELTYPVDEDYDIEDVGDVTVEVTGRNSSGTTGAPGATLEVTSDEEVRVHVRFTDYETFFNNELSGGA